MGTAKTEYGRLMTRLLGRRHYYTKNNRPVPADLQAEIDRHRAEYKAHRSQTVRGPEESAASETQSLAAEPQTRPTPSSATKCECKNHTERGESRIERLLREFREADVKSFSFVETRTDIHLAKA